MIPWRRATRIAASSCFAGDAASADDSAASGSFPVEEVVATLQRDGYAAFRGQQAQLFSVADELAPRQCLLLASACQLILLQRRSRLKVLSATLAAPGELSDSALHALRSCRDTEREAVLGVAGGMSKALRYAVSEELRVELGSVVEPLVGQLFTGGDRQETTARFLAVLDTLLSTVGRLISGHELPESLEMSNKPALIRDLDQVQALVAARLFATDVAFAVGLHSDYDTADWEYYADEYRGSCRLLVHMNWTYAVARASAVHSGAVSQLMDAVKKQLNPSIDDDDFTSYAAVDLEGIADRLGCGIVYKAKVDEILTFSSLLTGDAPSPDVIACQVAFTHEKTTHAFLKAANLLGPATQIQYCLAVKFSDQPPEQEAFWAALYVFRRVADPRTMTPTNEVDSRAAPGAKGHKKPFEVSGEKVYDRQVQTMSAADILRVFDMHLVYTHRAVESNIHDRVQFNLDILYPDGSSRQFTVPLGRYFVQLLKDWKGYWCRRSKKTAK
ncbi:uncharacterized protein LOC129600676 isoform X2 [Paramacrobiotus metropolitanus]|uniref:uncharacterized protein LOC129600676 isoform X2 n=1 Tax=Paramacrobiotus metropolitanus TaxID=2943436 RepID=UPI0024460117|nr:uncharacterized protein LOC129600676 isoform X2 [Paramacrobiotus metropolitanus]